MSLKRAAGVLLLSLVTLTACQSTPLSGLSNPLAGGVTAESCKQTFEAYAKEISEHPEKYEKPDPSLYPALQQYGKTLNACQEKGFLSPADMMKVMEKLATQEMQKEAQANGMDAVEAARQAEEAMRAMEAAHEEMAAEDASTAEQ